MQALVSTLVILLISISLYQVALTCRHGEIKGKCDTGSCNPDNMCHLCKCYRDAWDCSYGGYGSCSAGAAGQYYELGVYGDSKYMFSMTQSPFSRAKAACQDLGGGLATFDTKEERTAVNSFIDQAPQWTRSEDILIGAINTGTVWKWVDESNINYTLFPPPYEFAAWPQLYGEGPHCLIIQPWTSSARNPWDATRCAYRNYFMCKLPKSAVVSTYTGPEEPQDLGSLGNSSYSLLKTEKSWEALRRDCQRHGGDLAAPHSQAEWNFLLKAVKDAGIETEVFLGAHARSGTDSTWHWVDGQVLSKDDNRWDYPHPIHTGRSCLLMVQGRLQPGYYRDTECRNSYLGVCEKPLALELA